MAFHLPSTNAFNLPEHHPPWQTWLVKTLESAAWHQPWFGSRKALDDKFNLTATYRSGVLRMRGRELPVIVPSNLYGYTGANDPAKSLGH